MAQLEINGRNFDAIDTEIFGLGAKWGGVASASYAFSREHTNRYAVGSEEPVQYSMGPKIYEEGSLSLYMKEVVALENSTGGDKDITKVKPFKCLFTYLADDGTIVIDEVTWKFKQFKRTINIEGSGEAEEYTMHIISIRPNIPQ